MSHFNCQPDCVFRRSHVLAGPCPYICIFECDWFSAAVRLIESPSILMYSLIFYAFGLNAFMLSLLCVFAPVPLLPTVSALLHM